MTKRAFVFVAALLVLVSAACTSPTMSTPTVQVCYTEPRYGDTTLVTMAAENAQELVEADWRYEYPPCSRPLVNDDE